MNEELPATWPKTAEEIFTDFMGRHGGLVRALTADARRFHQLCDPEKDLLCLYGFPNGTWKVGPPAEEVPVNIPEPTLGINIARDGSSLKDWLSVIALHSDSWLISVAFYFGAFSEIKKIERDRLFQMINDYPTVLEIVDGYAKRQADHFGTPNSSSKIQTSRKPRQRKNHTSIPMKMTMAPKESRPPENHTSMRMKMPMAPKVSRQPVNYTSMPMKMPMAPKVSRQPVNYTSMPMMMPMAPKESRQPVNYNSMPWIMPMAPKESQQPVNYTSMPMKMTMAPKESRQPVNHISMPTIMTMAPKEHGTPVEVHEEQGITLCGACGKEDGPGEFWICCDTCNKWFHGLCVAITREEAEHVMHFKCPRCRGKQKQI